MTHTDSIWAKALEVHADSLQSKVELLQTKLDVIQSKQDFLYNSVETANDSVSNQLSAANNLLAIVGVVVTILAIWLGVQIEKKWRKMELMAQTVDENKKAVEELVKVVDQKKITVEELAKTVDEKSEEVDALAQATKDLNEKIHNDIKGLYYDLRREETKTFFERLVMEPQDINNIESLLLARDVDADNFPLLKEAFLKLPEEISPQEGDEDFIITIDGKRSYMLQFFQHFFYESLKDNDIQPIFTESFKNVFNNAFESDIIRATEGLCRALADTDTTFDKVEVLTEFLKAINGCKHKKFMSIRKILEEKINPIELLQRAIERCKEDNVNLLLFEETVPETH